jgi:iron complex outermembrane recepter protein
VSDRFNKATWRLALDYQFTADLLAYLSYNRGFKSGGFNSLNIQIPPFRPEQLDAYELGFKSTFVDNRVRFNGAFYY